MRIVRHTTVAITFIIFANVQRIISAEEGQSARIIGGTPTTVSKAPFLVNIRINGVFVCGGSMVSLRFVVTAAHCVIGVRPPRLTVVGGATLLSESGIKRSVAKVITPKEYSDTTLHMDVAVLKLADDMIGEDIAPINLCNSTTWKVGDTVQVYGWGRTAEKTSGSSNRIHTVTVPLMAKAKCLSMYRGKAIITKTMFCASVPASKDACSGDSGGPAIFNGQLCGIVSWGIGCARPNYPGVYTSITTVKSFLEKAIKL